VNGPGDMADTREGVLIPKLVESLFSSDSKRPTRSRNAVVSACKPTFSARNASLSARSTSLLARNFDPRLSARGLVERGVGEPSLREQVREALAVVERLSASTSSEPPRA